MLFHGIGECNILISPRLFPFFWLLSHPSLWSCWVFAHQRCVFSCYANDSMVGCLCAEISFTPGTHKVPQLILSPPGRRSHLRPAPPKGGSVFLQGDHLFSGMGFNEPPMSRLQSPVPTAGLGKTLLSRSSASGLASPLKKRGEVM